MTERIICVDCGNECDPDVCHCGVSMTAHDPYECGHMPVPMGCTCGYISARAQDDG